MSKRLIFLVLFALLGAFVIFQSCSDTPVTSEQNGLTAESKVKYDVPNVFDATGKLTTEHNIYILDAHCTQIKLWAGAGNRESARWVGNVYLTKNGNWLHVKYDFSDASLAPWVPISIHFDIADIYADLHYNSSGNPQPGLFDYSYDFPEPYAIVDHEFDIEIPPDSNLDGKYFVAAHAGVTQFGGIEGFNYYLPNVPVQLLVQQAPVNGGPAYWKFKINNAGFISGYDPDGAGPLLAGQYYGWCVDVDHTMGVGTYNNCMLYSSYETLPSWMIGNGKIEYPENFDKVNYLVNFFNVDQQVQLLNADCTPYMPGGVAVYGNITYGDIQMAIWSLIENTASTNGVGTYDARRVNAIKCAVNANGEGFIPACDQKIVFIVVPDGGTANIQLIIGQPIIGMTQVPCATQSETCWGDGKWGANWVGGNSWATWFKWNFNATCAP